MFGESAVALRAFDLRNWTEKYSFPMAPGTLNASPDGRQISLNYAESLVIGGLPNAPGHLLTWNARTGEILNLWESPSIAPAATSSAAFSEDSRFLACCMIEGGSRSEDKRFATPLPVVEGGHPVIQVWDTSTRQTVATIPVEAGSRLLQFLPDGRHLLSLDATGSIQIWDIAALHNDTDKQMNSGEHRRCRCHRHRRSRCRR